MRSRRTLAAVAIATCLGAAPAIPATANATPRYVKVYDNEFNPTNRLGTVTGCNHNGCTGAPTLRMGAQPDGDRDTAGNCVYNTDRTVSETNGKLHIHVYRPFGGPCYAVNLRPLSPSIRYGKYKIRFRADDIYRYHFVELLWPVDRIHGEIDFPEANLGSPWHGFIHEGAGGRPFWIEAQSTNPNGWHVAETDWLPSGITMRLDGHVLDLLNGPAPVPSTKMFPAIHVASAVGDAPTSVSHGNVDIDYVKVWRLS